MSDPSATIPRMSKSQGFVERLSASELLSATRHLVNTSRGVEAELLVHLGEIDVRRLYLDRAYRSMFAFCIGEYGFSEDVAYNRITVARAARRLPSILEAARSGTVHMTGLRLLAPHLDAENHVQVLAEAAGKTTRQIEELVARLAPRPEAATVIRAIHGDHPAPDAPPLDGPTSPPGDSALGAATVRMSRRQDRRSGVTPLTPHRVKFQFTASSACRDKLRKAQDLLRHRVPDGDVGTIVERALEALIEKVEKERFALHRKARKEAPRQSNPSRHIPAAVKRAAFKRDGGRCTFTDEQGNRCSETGGLEFDHLDGFARTGRHAIDGIRLLCRAHNQHAADQMYGRAFMQQARERAETQAPLVGVPAG